jgi:hypothetical protein
MKYEYKIEKVSSKSGAMLVEIDAQASIGWELVQVLPWPKSSESARTMGTPLQRVMFRRPQTAEGVAREKHGWANAACQLWSLLKQIDQLDDPDPEVTFDVSAALKLARDRNTILTPGEGQLLLKGES